MANERETFWSRLCEAMEDKGLEGDNTTIAAALIGKHQTAGTKWKQGGKPRMANAVELAQKLGVCVEWLLTGRGSKRPIPPMPEGLNELATIWPALSPDDQRRILAGAASLANLASMTAFTGHPERREALDRLIEGWQHRNHQRGPEAPPSRRKASPKKK